MQKLSALDYLAGVESTEKTQASAPTNLHMITGEVVSKSEDGLAKILMDGTVHSQDDSQTISIEALGGLEEGDIVTILLSGEQGHGMTPLALGSVGSIDRIVTNVSEIQADYVKATELEADVAELGYAHITDGVIDNATIDVADINDLSAEVANIADAQIANATIEQAQVRNLSVDYASADSLEAAEARIGTLETTALTANSATIQNLEADTAKIHNLTANQISAATGYVADLTAGNVTAQNIISDHGDFSTVKADSAKIHNLTANQISAATGYIGALTSGNVTAQNIISDHGDFSTVKANAAKVANLTAQELEADHATIGTLDATYAQIDMANVNNGWITNGTIKNAAIKSQMVESISASQLTAGTIDADEITVQNLKASSLAVQTADGYVYVGEKRIPTKEFLDSLKDELQAEIDGAIETFTVSAIPTLNNTPANEWVVSGDTEATRKLRAKHVGDIAYVINEGSSANGHCYRFAYDNTTQTFGWVLIQDSDVTSALSRISNLETFESNTTSWIEETDEGLTTIRQNHTTLSGKVDKTVVETKQLWYTKSNTTAPTKPNSTTFPNGVTSTSTSGNAWRVVVPAYNASYPNYYYCLQYKLADGTFAWSDVVRDIAMGESQQQGRKGVSDAATAQTTANNAATAASTADGKAVAAQTTANSNIKSSVQLWFTKANTTAPNKPTAQVTTNSASTVNAWNLAIPTYNSSYPNYFSCYQQQKGDGTWQWTDVVFDRSITEAQAKAQAALPSSEFTTFQSTTFKNLVDEVDEQSSTITNLTTTVSNKADSSTVTTLSNTVNSVSQTTNSNSQYITNLTTTLGTNADGTSKSEDIVHKYNQLDQTLDGTVSRVGKTEASLTTISNQNLSPFYSHPLDDINNATDNPNGYWVSNQLVSGCTSLTDGWTHYEKTNTASSTAWLLVYESAAWRNAHGGLKGDTKYTVLLEFRNVTKSGNVTAAGITKHATSNPSMFVADTTSNPVVNGVQYHIGTTVADTTASNIKVSTRTLISLPAGASISCDLRVSLYEGEYNGSYKPYVDQSLITRMSSAETSIEQNATDITLRATKEESYQMGQPNLTPYFLMPMTQTTDDYWFNINFVRFTQLSDGWAHFEYNNTGSSTVNNYIAPKVIETLVPGGHYTLLVEYRNVSISKDGGSFYSQQVAQAQVWGTAPYGGFEISNNAVRALENGEGAFYKSLTLLTAESKDPSGTVRGTLPKTSFMYINQQVAAGQSISYDLRLSLYEGEYTGPYKPYSGTKLYASQAELKVANDRITSEVSARETLGQTVASNSTAIEQNASNITLSSKRMETIDGNMLYDVDAPSLAIVNGPSVRYFSDAGNSSFMVCDIREITNPPTAGINYMAHWSVSGSSEGKARGLCFYGQSHVQFISGQKYTFSCWVRCTSGKFTYYNTSYSGSFPSNSGARTIDSSLDSSWQFVTTTVTATKTTLDRVYFSAKTLSDSLSFECDMCGFKLTAAAYATQAELKVANDNINLRVEKNDVINQINLSTEGATISASKVNIEGAAIFTSGRLSDSALASVRLTLTRNNFSDSYWSGYETIGHTDNWQNYHVAKGGTTSATGFASNTLRVGDLVVIEGVSIDTGNTHRVTVKVTQVPSGAGSTIPATTVNSVNSNGIQVGVTNLYAFTNAVQGYIRSSNPMGDIVLTPTSPQHTTSDFIPVSAGDVFTIQMWNPNLVTNTTNSNRGVCWYDSSKAYISFDGGTGDAASSRPSGVAHWSWTCKPAPSNAAYVRFGFIIGPSTNVIDPDIKVKVEKGNRATDWTPAPEDQTAYVDSSVDGVQVGVTNLLKKSHDLNLCFNSNSNVSSIVGGKADPDGGTGAYLITPSSTSWWSGPNGSNCLLKNLSVPYTFSIWLRADSDTQCKLCCRYMDSTPYSSNATRAVFDVTTTWQRFYISGPLKQVQTSDSVCVWIGQVTNVPIYAYHPKVEIGTKPSDWSPAPEDVAADISAVSTVANNAAPKSDAVYRQQRIWYRQTVNGAAPSVNNTWLATSGTGYGNWSLGVPQLTSGTTKYPKLYTAVQTQTVSQAANGGTTCSCSPVRLDDSQTVIDGGNIITGSVTANQLSADSVTADKVAAGAITATKLNIGDSQNYSALDINTAEYYGFTYDSTEDGRWYTMNTPKRDTLISPRYDCKGGEKFRVTYEVSSSVQGYASSSSTSSTYLPVTVGFFLYKDTGAGFSWPSATKVTGSASATPTAVDSIVSFSADARGFAAFIQIDGKSNFSGTFKIRNLKIYKMTGGELIVDGSIVAAKLDANSVKTNIVQTTDLSAAKITSGDISADRIKANVISAINSLSAGTINGERVNANQLTIGGSHLATQTDVDNVQVGVTNLMKESNAVIRPTMYECADIYLLEPLESGQTYTIQLWDVDVSHASKTAAQLGVNVYYCGGSVAFGGWIGTDYFTNGHADHLQMTFTPYADKVADTSGGNAIASQNLSHSSVTNKTLKFIRLYNSYPNADGAKNFSVGRYKLEKGNKPTDWTPSLGDSLSRNLLGGTQNDSWMEMTTSDKRNTYGYVAPYNTFGANRTVEAYDADSNAVVINNDTATGNRGVSWYTKVGAVKAGATYTFSCMLWSSVSVSVHTHTAWRTSADSAYTGWTSEGAKTIPANAWTAYSYTFTPHSTANLTWEFQVAICCTGNSSGVTFKAAHAQLEVGNTATAWDATQSRIFDASKTATNYISANSSGIKIANANPSTATTYQLQTSTGTDFVVANALRNRINGDGMTLYDGSGTADSNVMAKFRNDSTQIGKAGAPHVTIASIGMDVYGGSSGSVNLAHFGYDTGNAESGTAVAPYYTLGMRTSGSEIGNYSLVTCGTNTASGWCSYAEGSGNESSGNYTHAEGVNTESSGEVASHAEGVATKSTGYATHTQNIGTIASNNGSTAIGKYNVDGNYALMVGNGYVDDAVQTHRSNAMTVDWDGNAVLAGALTLGGTIKKVYAGTTVVTLNNGSWLTVASASTVTSNLGSGASQTNTICIAQNGDFNAYAGVVTGAMGKDGSARAYIYPNRTGSIRINYILIRFA